MSSLNRKDVKGSIRHFTPAWFAVIMGTGVISILFENYPYGNETDAMRIFSAIFFFLNLFLFVLFTITTLWRYVLFPDIWHIMLRHPVQSLYLGCFPMGATTLLNVSVSLFYSSYGFGGTAFLYTIWGLWWLDLAISFLCCWGLAHIMSVRHHHSLENMTSVWLLPVVTLVVAASSGGVLALSLQAISPSHALVTIVFAIFSVTIGLSLALMILTIYLYRLIIYGPPPRGNVISSFIPLGPTGQAGFAIVLIGQYFQEALPVAGSTSPFLGSAQIGEIVYGLCICLSFALWALSTMWLIFALLGVQSVVRKHRFPFKVPFWGLIFPNVRCFLAYSAWCVLTLGRQGVYANLTIELYRVFNARFFRVWGAIYAGATLVLWTAVFVRTLFMVRYGEIFEAPCLEDVDMGLFQKKPCLPPCAGNRDRGASSPSTDANAPVSGMSSAFSEKMR